MLPYPIRVKVQAVAPKSRMSWPVQVIFLSLYLIACNQGITSKTGRDGNRHSASEPMPGVELTVPPSGSSDTYRDAPMLAEDDGLEEGLASSKREHSSRKEDHSAAMLDDYKESGDLSSPAGANAGSLTAGEVNDLAKFELWEGISRTSLASYAATWQIGLGQRYAVVVRNSENGAVVGASVQLVTKRGTVLWRSVTNNSGRAELYDCLDSGQTQLSGDLILVINYMDQDYQTNGAVPYTTGISQVVIDVACEKPTAVDIAFVVDATGSMGDEINYLKAELLDVIDRVNQRHTDVDIHTAAVFYRDLTDEYVTRTSDFSADAKKTVGFVKEQYADGGGDMPEAVDSALSMAVNTLSWRNPARAKLLFLVLDAPPHTDAKALNSMKLSLEKAAEQGIRIIPIVCSGSDKSNEFLMRAIAVATGGTYLFLTDHSGIGAGHITPTTDSFNVRYLNDLMIETIDRYLDVLSCANDQPNTPIRTKSEPLHHVVADSTLYTGGKTQEPQEISLHVSPIQSGTEPVLPLDKPTLEQQALLVYPNPSNGRINVVVEFEHDYLWLLDGTGQLLRQFQVTGHQYSLDLSSYADGIYLVRATNDKGKDHTARIVLQH